MPPEPPHDHRDYVGIARVLDIGLVQTTSTGAVPFIKGPLHRRARRARVVPAVINLGPVNPR